MHPAPLTGPCPSIPAACKDGASRKRVTQRVTPYIYFCALRKTYPRAATASPRSLARMAAPSWAILSRLAPLDR